MGYIPSATINRNNNLDLIRLLAASQVMLLHGAKYLKIKGQVAMLDYFLEFISWFPGVPIFFFISGLLITHSYIRNRATLKKYIKNRFLRLYPALWVCIGITVIAMVTQGALSGSELMSTDFFKWLTTQLTFFQFYTPEIFRDWGVGVPNGSLWTISVEVQFYIVLPILLSFLFLFKKEVTMKIILAIIIIASIMINAWVFNNDQDNTVFKLLKVNILTYLAYFLAGTFCYFYFDKVKRIFEGKWWLWPIVYLGVYSLIKYGFHYENNSNHLDIARLITISFLFMAVLSLAFSFNTLSARILKGNDFSYGIYIYHMPVFNTLLAFAVSHTIGSWVLAICITALCGILSWFLIEKPMLRRK